MRGYYITLVFVLFLLPCASAELLFSPPHEAYNFGDELSMTLSLRPSSDTTDFASVELVCGRESVTLYRSLISVSSAAPYEINLNPKLESNLFGAINGSCYLDASFSSDDAQSQRFILTQDITTEINIPSTLVNPGEVFPFSGLARKINGQLLNGFAKATLDDANTSLTSEVLDGGFSFNLSLPSKLNPGQHKIEVMTYEEDSRGRIINRGYARGSFVVRTVLTSVDISVVQLDVNPARPFEYTFFAYDQADAPLERDVRYDIYSPNGNKPFFSKITKTGVSEKFVVEANYTPGYWRVEAFVGEYNIKKLFYVEEYELVKFDIENNDTLVVTNLGNIPYKRSVQIDIGEHSSIKDIELDIGQTRRYKLKAPESVYTITVNDGNRTLTAKGVRLTGRAIDIGEVSGSIMDYWWAGLFVLGLLGISLVTNTYISRRRESRGFGKESNYSAPMTKVVNTMPGTSGSVSSRESALILAICSHDKTERAKNIIRDSITKARLFGATVNYDSTHHIITLSPRFTKKLENDLLAVQIATEIKDSIVKSSLGQEISFGIGVNRGEIIVDGRSNTGFTSIGSVIPSTKSLANKSKNEVLISDEVHAKIRGSIKSDRAKDVKAWNVKEIVNRESHSSFIDGFLRRQSK